VMAPLSLTAYSPLINTSAQLLLAINPNLSFCWICFSGFIWLKTPMT
jgi:hypothetical protein